MASLDESWSSGAKALLVLPDDWTETDDTGFVFGTGPVDRRRFPRYCYRRHATVQYAHGGPPQRDVSERYLVVTLDISREGLSILHFEPLFPGEVVKVWLPGDVTTRLLEIARCRRLGPRCFESGGHFVNQSS